MFATAGQYAAIRASVSSAYEMLGFSICSLLMRSFISLATSTLSLEVTSLTCKSERRLGAAPGPISGQSRPVVWPRAGRQPRTPLKRSMNAIRFHRGADAEMVSGSRTADAAATAVRNILHLQPAFDLYSAAQLVSIRTSATNARGSRFYAATPRRHVQRRCRWRRSLARRWETSTVPGPPKIRDPASFPSPPVRWSRQLPCGEDFGFVLPKS